MRRSLVLAALAALALTACSNPTGPELCGVVGGSNTCMTK